MVKKRTYRKRSYRRRAKGVSKMKRTIKKLNNDGKISKKIRTYANVTETNTVNNATALINWFGVTSFGMSGYS